jgi:hypothetical protein
MRPLNRIALFGFLALAATAAPLAAQQAPHAAADSVVNAAVQEGTTAAQTIGTGLWTVGGFAGGAVLGPIGAGLAYALASSSASSLPQSTATRIGKKEADFQLGFQQAYTDKLTTRRRSSAMVGGVAGTALFTVGMLVWAVN